MTINHDRRTHEMRMIDSSRRQVVYGQDLARKFKRLAMLFSIVDILILCKIAYNFTFELFQEKPFVFIFWIAILAIAGIISIFLTIRLWLIEREKAKEIEIIDQIRRDQLNQEREARGF